MMCAWKELLSILPPWLAKDIDRYENEILLEIRLRLGQPPQLIQKFKTIWLRKNVTMDDLNYCINIDFT